MTILSYLHAYMPYVMGAWLVIGLLALVVDVVRVIRDERRLLALDPLAAKASAADPAGKIRVSGEFVTWADQNRKAAMARWIYTIHNTVRAGNQPDASAITDSIWSQERERHLVFRFFAKNAILVGLLFTSVGLCLTLSGVGPALQAPSGDFEVWKQGMQRAMVDALGGMALAFYSSLYGIGITIALHFAALITLVWRHERYLADLDGFVQGSLIPIFSLVVEKDRNDVIVEVMERTEKAFNSVSEQYAVVLEDAKVQREELVALRKDFRVASQDLQAAMRGFGTETTNLNIAAGKMEGTHLHITQAIADGLERMERAQAAMMAEYGRFQTDVVVPFANEVTTQFGAQQQVGNDLLQRIGDVTQSFEEVADGMRVELQSISKTTAAASNAAAQLAKEVTYAMRESGEALGNLSTKQENFIAQFGEMNRLQTSALQKSADDQELLLKRVEDIVASFSISSEGVKRQLAEVYELHRVAVSKMYDQISEVLSSALKGIIERSNEDVVRFMSEGVQTAVRDTHDRLMGLDTAFGEIATAQKAGADAMEQISRALTFNEAAVAAEMQLRRTALDKSLEQMAAAAAVQLGAEGKAAVEQFVQQVSNAFNASLERQERIVTELNVTVGRKWDDLLTAYIAGAGLEASAV